MKFLYLSLQHLPEALPESIAANEQAWGKLELYVDNGLDRIELLTVEWHLSSCVRWLLNSHFPKLYQPLPPKHRKDGETIAQACRRTFSIGISAYNTYIACHSFLPAFSHAMPIPKIIIAFDKRPHYGEVGLAYNPQANFTKHKFSFQRAAWAYPIDLEQYYQDTRWNLLQFLEEWCEIAPNERIKAEARSLFHQCRKSPESY
jgi:hypothetical protein